MQIQEAHRGEDIIGTKGNKRQTLPMCAHGGAAATSAGSVMGDSAPHLTPYTQACVCSCHQSPSEKLLNVDLGEKLNEPEARQTDERGKINRVFSGLVRPGAPHP